MASPLDFDREPTRTGRPSSQPGRSSKSRGRKQKSQTPEWLLPVALVVIAIVAAAGGFGAWKVLFARHLELGPVAVQQAKEQSEFRVKIPVVGLAHDEVRFALGDEPPKGARVDATGEFHWTPGEDAGGSEFPITVIATAKDDEDLTALTNFKIAVEEVLQPPVLEPIADVTMQADNQLTLEIRARDPDKPTQPLTYKLAGAPQPGLEIEPRTGYLQWNLAGVKPGTYELSLQVLKPGGLRTGQTFRVQVLKKQTPVDVVADKLRGRGITIELQAEMNDPMYRGKGRLLAINGELARIFEYSSASQASEDAHKTPADIGVTGKPNVFQNDKVVLIYAGKSPRTLASLKYELGKPIFEATGPVKRAEPTMPVSTLAAEQKNVEDDAIYELYTKRKLFIPKEYPTLRKLFAAKFERQYDRQIRQGFGDGYDEMMKWLNSHVDIKEEFFLAIQPSHDKVVEVFRLFKELKEKFPKQIEPYANLAIATSVVWDDPKSPGIYRYWYHAKRTHSNMSGKEVGAIENFQYLVDHENVLEGRAREMPWEFLTLLVNHTTPLAEREWALKHYLDRRTGFGKCYSEVPYDDEMLRTASKTCKLDGKDYTLANILKYGGVCAMQADFAARVGKSIGVPAMYVGGESRSGDLHAWVNWIELLGGNKNSVSFSIESHGRYGIDRYYVGDLEDAQTGQPTTDRALQLRCDSVGRGTITRRHSALVMQAYPIISEHGQLDVSKKLLLLRDTIRLCPENEAAWTAVASLSRAGEIKKGQQKMMVDVLKAFFTTFAAFPDFTWEIFDNFVAYQQDVRVKAQSYVTLVGMYEAAERPDLACKARLKLTEYLVNDKKYKDAIAGLAFTIMKFPDEGRYVPQMLDQLEAICKTAQNAPATPGKKSDVTKADLVNFYSQFLPKVPQRRGDEASPYAIAMLERGLNRFQEAGETQLAQACKDQLSKLKATK